MGDNRLEPLVLSDAERRTLENWAKRRKTAQGLALRARIVLACAEGRSNTAVSARLRVSRVTVAKWRARFLARRLDGLGDEPRPGVPRTITDAQVEEVVVRTLEETPEGATHWSKRELARQVGISPASVHRIWRAFGLQPWRTETFKISPDPLLIDKIRDVVGLYLAPPANAAVFAVDEKPQIQALERTAPVLPMIPGVPERRSFDYTRHGTIDLFAALNTATGKVIGKLSAQHRAVDFRDFLDEIDRQTEPGLAIHVICDNLSAHKAPAVHKWLLAHPRVQLHFTPTYSSWISQVPVNRPSVGDTRGFSEVPHLGAGRGQTRVRCLGGGVDGAACRAGWRWSPCRGVRRGRRAGQPVSCASGVAGILTGHGPGVCL